jgi:hypothetical protein
VDDATFAEMGAALPGVNERSSACTVASFRPSWLRDGGSGFPPKRRLKGVETGRCQKDQESRKQRKLREKRERRAAYEAYLRRRKSEGPKKRIKR